MKNMKKSVLFMAGTAITGMAYVPPVKARPSREFVEATYIRKTRVEKWQASEERKRVLQNEILKIKKEIRNRALTYQVDRNTKISAITATGKSSIHCTRLINKLFN